MRCLKHCLSRLLLLYIISLNGVSVILRNVCLKLTIAFDGKLIR